MKQFILTALLSTTILSSSLTFPAIAGGHSSQKAIGETTALIPEAGLTTSPLKDGESANTNFPFANFKAIATVGEMDAESELALTGYPDGQAAMLADDADIISSFWVFCSYVEF